MSHLASLDTSAWSFKLGEVYRRLYGRKLSFTATRERSRKRDFRTYIRRYTFPNENVEYGNPHSNALLQFRLKFERCKPHNAARHATKYDVINDVKLFPAVCRRIYCHKFLTSSNQKSRYKSKCIRMRQLIVCWPRYKYMYTGDETKGPVTLRRIAPTYASESTLVYAE